MPQTRKPRIPAQPKAAAGVVNLQEYKDLQQRYDNLARELDQLTENVRQAEARTQKLDNYYQRAMLTVMDQLTVLTRTIGIIIGKVE